MAFKQLKLYFDGDVVTLLAHKLLAHGVNLDEEAFVHIATQDLDGLELKARVEHIADALWQHLPFSYPEAVTALVAILGSENEKETGMFKAYYWVMPIAKLVEKYGLAHFEPSMYAIEEITKRNTGEYAIRPFIEKYPDQTLQRMLAWSKAANPHVRRLASEGVRPRLPWAPKLYGYIKDPTPILPVLDNLKDDPSKYVQKSVGNCINDILKDNLEVGKQLIESWVPNATKQRQWIIKHALRNLVKADDGWVKTILP